MNNKETDKKNIFRLVGNIITVLALVFVVWKLVNLDIDYSKLASLEAWIGIIILSVIYGVIIVIYGWPWRNYVSMITHVKLDYISVAYVMAKSNMLKYVPGNVFQYVGRNQLAVDKNLKHSDVGMATIFDVATNLLAAALLGCLFYFEGFKKVVVQFGGKAAIAIAAVFFVALFLFLIVYFKKKELIVKYTSLLKEKKNLITIMTNLVFYMINMFINATMYIATLIMVLDMEMHIKDIYILLGAFILSWIVGFIVPGAPGGIGIREFVITLLLPMGMDAQMVLFGIVVYRLINIIGDVFGLLFTVGLKKRFRS